MIVKLITSQKAEVWVNLDQVVRMSTISVQDGYPSTEIIMANGAAIIVYENRYSELDQSPLAPRQRCRPGGQDRPAQNSPQIQTPASGLPRVG